MTDSEKLAFARRMMQLGYARWDAVLRGVVSFDQCAASHLEELVEKEVRQLPPSFLPRF
jgi:hypothetical protein